MNIKEDIINELVKLSQEELYELSEALNYYVKLANKTQYGGLFIKYIAFRGYDTLRSFGEANNLSYRPDTTIGLAIQGKGDSISCHIKLKNVLNIDDEIFINYMKDKIKD